MQQYIAAYGENLLKKSNNSKQKCELLQSKLHSAGISTKQLRQIEKGTQTIISKDMKKMLKRNFTNLALSYEKKSSFELLTNYTSYYNMLEIAKESNFFNSNPGQLTALKEETKREVSNFLTGEIDRQVVETKLQTNSITELKQVFDKFNGMAEFSKFNAGAYMRTFQQKLDNEGLKPFLSPDILNPLDSETPDQSNQQPHQEKDPYAEIELESMEKELIDLYIQSHFTLGFFDSIKCKLAIRKSEKNCKSKY